MRGTLHRSGNSGSKQLAAIDQLLIAGIKLGPAKKREAINRVLELVPEWTRGDCWQRIKRVAEKRQTRGSLRSATPPRQRSLGKLPQPDGQPPGHGRRRMTTGC